MKWGRCSKDLPTTQFLLLNIVLGIGHFITILNAGAYLPMLPYVAGSIGEGLPYAVWGQSNYFTAMGAAFLIARPLMRRFGPRDTAISAYLLFAVSSLIILLTTSVYPLMTAARTLQGFSAGLSLAPSLFFLLNHYKKSQHSVAIALWGIAAFTPFSIGPALGGYCAYVLGDWRILFAVSAGLSLLVAGVIWAILEEPEPDIDITYFISPHLYLFFLFIGAGITLQLFFNVGLISALTSQGYELWLCAVAFMTFTSLFWFKNRNHDNPLIKLQLFKYPNYAFGMLILCLAFMAFQSSVVQYLIRLQTVEGYTAWHAGLIFLPLFVFSKPINVWAQYLLHHGHDPRLLACISFFAFAVSFWWMSRFARPAPWESLIWPQFLEGAALGLLLISMTTIALSNVPTNDQLHAIDILNTFRNISAGLAITFSDIAWDRYIAHVKSYLTAPASMNQEFLATNILHATPSDDSVRHLLHQKIMSQSGLLTLNAMFHTLALIFALLALIIWFASPKHIVHKTTELDSVVESLGEEP